MRNQQFFNKIPLMHELKRDVTEALSRANILFKVDSITLVDREDDLRSFEVMLVSSEEGKLPFFQRLKINFENINDGAEPDIYFARTPLSLRVSDQEVRTFLKRLNHMLHFYFIEDQL